MTFNFMVTVSIVRGLPRKTAGSMMIRAKTTGSTRAFMTCFRSRIGRSAAHANRIASTVTVKIALPDIAHSRMHRIADSRHITGRPEPPLAPPPIMSLSLRRASAFIIVLFQFIDLPE